MRYIADANTFLAAALDEPEKAWIVEATTGCQLAAPPVLPYEVANALSALVKRKAINSAEAAAAWDAVAGMPVELVEFDIRAALLLAIRFGLYAYDAFYIQCCLEAKLPLISLDNRMCELARNLGIKVAQ